MTGHLSLLDVLTCGTGGILLTFVVVAAELREQPPRPGKGDEGTAEPRSPFVIFVVRVERGPGEPEPDGGREDGGRDDGLRLLVAPPRAWQPAETVVGSDHAILYADHPPPPGIRIRLGQAAGDGLVPVTVRILHRGNWSPARETAVSPETPAEVWPGGGEP